MKDTMDLLMLKKKKEVVRANLVLNKSQINKIMKLYREEGIKVINNLPPVIKYNLKLMAEHLEE